MSSALPNPPARLEGIESLRAYAAVAIVLFHVAWIGGAQPPKPIEFVKWHGGFGVQLFFVVSAFSLAYGYWERLASDTALKTYFRRRFARIAPLYYVIFMVTLAYLYQAGATLPSLLDIGLCVAFVFNFVPRLADGIVPASWSIGVEMVFYVLFPFVLMLARNWWVSTLLLLVSWIVAVRFASDLSGAVASVPAYVSHSIVAQLPYFCWGILAFHAYRSIQAWPFIERHRRGVSWTIAALSVALLASIIGSSELFQFFSSRGLRTTWDALWGLPFAMLCIGLAIHPTRFLSNAVTRYLGKVSYSLYLVHPPVVGICARAGLYRSLYDQFPGYPLVAFTACAVLTLAMVAAISALTFRYIEAPGMRWGKRTTSSAVGPGPT